MARAIDAYVGSRIRDRRIELGASLDELANRAGIDAGQLNDLENGIERISPDMLVSIATALRCPLSWLFGLRTEALPGLGFTREDPAPAESQDLARR
jgi:transcriptional regulator with XRE-family HTH domain